MQTEKAKIGERIGAGRTAEVYAWGANQVIKLYYDWCPPAWAAAESETARRLNALGVPAPMFYEEIQYDGRSGVIYERIEGPTGMERFKQKPFSLGKLLEQMAALHIEIHTKPGADFPTLKEDWLGKGIDRAEDLTTQEKYSLRQHLDSLPDGDRLCHGDFHTDQVLFGARGMVVLDWTNACCGHPAADLARTLLMFRIGEAPGMSQSERMLTAVLRPLICRIYQGAYLRRNPQVSGGLVSAYLLPVAAARLNEKIPGEAPKLLRIIRRGLAA